MGPLSRSPSPKAKTAVPSIIVHSSPSRTTSIDGSLAGDPAAAALYKVRRVPRIRSKSRRGRCSYTPRQTAKCWAFTNLAFSVLDVIFSLCELVAYTLYTRHLEAEFDSDERNNLHWAFFLTSLVLHGDCYETLIEIVITFMAELVYVISSILFAFAATLGREDYAVSRCLAQWFQFSLWIPPLALLPRFFLNVISFCGGNFVKLFPNSNENAPRIAFWIVNLVHVFFMMLWVVHGRLVALKFIAYRKEEEQKLSTSRIVRGGSRDSRETLHGGPSVTTVMSSMGGAGDKDLRRSGVGAMLPPTMAMV